jgi:NitT/TauT family transport system substrate-binding protein
MLHRAIGVVALLVGLAAHGLGAHAAEPLKIRLGWSVAPAQIVPMMFDRPGVAKHQGKSYVMEPVRIPGSSVALNLLATGELEIAPMTFTQLGPAIQNAGLTDLRIIADDLRDGVEGYETNRYAVHADSPIKKIEDLKGKVVAVPGIGSGMDVFMRVMLRKHGLEFPRDYTLVEVVFPNMGPVLADKKADLVVAVKPFYLNPSFGGIARTLFTQKDAVGPTDMVFFTARDGFLKKNRAAVVDFLEDMLRAIRWFNDPRNHDDVVQVASRFTKVPAERLGWIFTKEDFYRDLDARPDIPSLQRSVDMLKDVGFLKETIEVRNYVDLSLIEEAGKRLK